MTVPTYHIVKMKESEELEKYQDPAWELRKLGNMKVKVIPIIVGTLGIVPKKT